MKQLFCIKKERGSRERCGEVMIPTHEGGLNSKYDVFRCEKHGSISVLRGANRGEYIR